MYISKNIFRQNSSRSDRQVQQGVKRAKKAGILGGAMSLALLLLVPAGAVSAATQSTYTKTNLVSDLPGIAQKLDPNLANPWGLSHSRTSPWWVSDNGTGKSSIYNGDGTSVIPAVSVPAPDGGTGTPTGNVFNKVAETKPHSFVISKGTVSGPSTFIFATEDGTIEGWNKTVDSAHAIIAADRSKSVDTKGDTGAVYKGLAYGSHHEQQYIYATNFRFGTVEMFDKNFSLVKSFTDPQLANTCPTPGLCYAPFGIQNIHGDLYVTFALQGAGKEDDQAGAGHGFVDVFRTDGTYVKRLISQGNLNSPWGLALAPHNFGSASKHLLVGNFGDGTINVYDLRSGNFDDKLKDVHGPIQVNGLWALAFGNNNQAGKKNELFFTAGVRDETHGIFGKIAKD